MPSIFDSYGVQKGLAYKHNFQSDINNMLQVEQFRDKKRLQRERKAQYYASKIERGHASTQYNSKRLEPYYNKLNNELGEFITSNPNWEQDINLVSKFNELTDKYLNNPILREELEIQKNLELVRQDRHNMSDDHFNMLMEQYDQYDKQEFNPEDPLSESKNKFSYAPESKLNFGAIASLYGKNNVKTVTKTLFAGDEEIIRTSIDQDSLEMAYSIMSSDTESKKALDAAWRSYKGNDYTTKKDFGIAALRSTIDIKELRNKLSPVGGDGSGGIGDINAFNPYTFNIIEDIYENGSATLSQEAIAFTEYGSVGSVVNPKDDGITFIGGIPMNKYEHINSLSGMRTTNAYELRYVPENKSWVMDIGVVFDKPSGQALEDLLDKGFIETDNYYSYFGEKVAELQGGVKKKGIHGKISVPADPTDTNRYLLYEQEMGGRGLKQQTISQQNIPIVQRGFQTISDVITNREKGIKPENQLGKENRFSTQGGEQEYQRPIEGNFWNEDQLNIALENL